MSNLTHSKTYPWALTGIFAAVHLVITLIPYSIAVAGTGEITFGLISAPIVGFLLGPFFGVIAVFIGSIIALFINPSIALIGPFTAIATAAGAFAAGVMRTKWRLLVPIFYILAMDLFLFSPIGVYIPYFIMFHFVVFILSIAFFMPGLSKKLIEPLMLDKNFNRVTGIVSLWLLSIVAVTLDNVVGGTIGAYYFSLLGAPPEALAAGFALGIPLIPIERLLGSVVVALVLIALAEVLARADFGLPLSRVGHYELLELSEEEI